MSPEFLLQLLAGIAMVFAILAFSQQLRLFAALPRPVDRAEPKGSVRRGVLYAFTLGMAPWSKESTRIHWISYLRGVAFHLGIFLGLGILVLSPWIPTLSPFWRGVLAAGAGLGAILGLAGFAARFIDGNLKALSTRDDFFTVLLVSMFLAVTALWLVFSAVLPAAQPLYFLMSAALLVYAPFSKIRHCLYYAYSRLFFGRLVGSHAVLPHNQQTLPQENQRGAG